MTRLYTASAGVIDIPRELHRLDLEDLWTGIKRIRRYGAQVDWTVYQHSVLVSHLVPFKSYPMALAHDLAEGLLGDLQRPIRELLSADASYTGGDNPYEGLHKAVNAEIGRRHSWPEGWDTHPDIVAADQRAFQIEVLTLMPEHHRGRFGAHGWSMPSDGEARSIEVIRNMEVLL